MGVLSSSRIFGLALFIIGSVFASTVVADEALRSASDNAMEEGKIAFEAKMYDFSKQSFEKAIELNRANYEAMLYLAKASFQTGDLQSARKNADNLVSSFYPAKELKIEAFQLLGDVENKQGNPWLALSYIFASKQLSTNIDLSHLVDDQMAKLDFNSLSYPDFNADSDGVITSPTLSFSGGVFSDIPSKGNFEKVSYSVSSLGTRFVVLPGFDDRNRFTKLLMVRIVKGLKPKLEEIEIQDRKRGGFIGANDLYVKVMDWNFDGYPDLAVRVSSKRNNLSEGFLIYVPQSDKFVLNEELSQLHKPILDRGTKAVLEEECGKSKDGACTRKRYKLFNGKYSLAEFEKNVCNETCIYTKAEIEVSSLRTNEHMYLVNTIETEFEKLKSRFSSSDASHVIITRRLLKAYYTPNYDVQSQDKPIMLLDLDGSWEFPASYVKNWVNNYFSKQPLNGQLSEEVSKRERSVIN